MNLSKLLPDGASDLDLMTDSPTQVDFKQLRELYIQTTAKEKRESPAPAAQ